MNNIGERLKGVKEYFRIIKTILSVAHKDKIHLFLIMLVSCIFRILEPYPMIVFPALIIDNVVYALEIKVIVIYVLSMGLSSFMIHFLSTLVDKKRYKLQDLLKIQLNERLSEKILDIDYELLENDDFISKVQRAKVAVDGDLSWSVLRGISGDRGVDAIIMCSINLVSGIFKILGFVAILSQLNGALIILLLVCVTLSSFIGMKKKREDYNLREHTSRVATRVDTCYHAMDDLSRARDIRLFSMQDFLVDKYRENRKDYFKIRRAFFNTYFSVEFLSQLITGLQNVFVYLYLGYKVLKMQVSIGSFSKYISTINSFVTTLTGMFDSIVNIKLFGDYMEDFCDILSIENAIFSSQGKEIKEIRSLEAKNIWFKYPGCKDWVLQDVSFELRPNEKLLLVGLNGAGKSTLVKLLLGIYKPTQGQILLNGEKLQQYNGEQYRSLLSAVFQDYKIYAESVKENIEFYDENTEKLEKVIKEIKLDEIVNALPQKINTILSREFDNEGHELSQGQKQKVVLARSLYKKAQLLVLDEPMAALDARAEYELYQEFNKLTENKIVIYISHRLAASHFCDNIMVLRNGKIIERGSHDQLMNVKGHYYDMYMRQAENYAEKEDSL